MHRTIELESSGHPWPEFVPWTLDRIASATTKRRDDDMRRWGLGLAPRQHKAPTDTWIDADGRMMVRVIPIKSLEALDRRSGDAVRRMARRALRDRIDRQIPFDLHTVERYHGRIVAVTYRTR